MHALNARARPWNARGVNVTLRVVDVTPTDAVSSRAAARSAARSPRSVALPPDRHDGPVWQVAWAHPTFGTVLASCGYDHKVIIWKESNGSWTKAFEYVDHQSSVNSIAWAPYEYGLVLACASSDSFVSVLTHKPDNDWDTVKFTAHQIGSNSVSWASPEPSAAGDAAGQQAWRIVSGGCDRLVKIWKLNVAGGDKTWVLEETMQNGHSDWVRSVSWAPNVGLTTSTIASGSQDGQVLIWTRNEQNVWTRKELPKFGSVVYGVSWSPMGNILAVATGDNKVTLWKENLEGEWTSVTGLPEAGAAEGQ